MSDFFILALHAFYHVINNSLNISLWGFRNLRTVTVLWKPFFDIKLFFFSSGFWGILRRASGYVEIDFQSRIISKNLDKTRGGLVASSLLKHCFHLNLTYTIPCLFHLFNYIKQYLKVFFFILLPKHCNCILFYLISA